MFSRNGRHAAVGSVITCNRRTVGVVAARMQKATITIRNGSVVTFQPHLGGMGLVHTGGEALYAVLKKLGKEGWRVEGEFPPYTIAGRYEISIVKD